jgi:hypothetical protein
MFQTADELGQSTNEVLTGLMKKEVTTNHCFEVLEYIQRCLAKYEYKGAREGKGSNGLKF